jgi:hypothetical protein
LYISNEANLTRNLAGGIESKNNLVLHNIILKDILDDFSRLAKDYIMQYPVWLNGPSLGDLMVNKLQTSVRGV